MKVLLGKLFRFPAKPHGKTSCRSCREVHKAVHVTKRHTVALKRILMHNEKEGMPVTALREIKILKALHHPCIVDILDMFVVRSK